MRNCFRVMRNEKLSASVHVCTIIITTSNKYTYTHSHTHSHSDRSPCQTAYGMKNFTPAVAGLLAPDHCQRSHTHDQIGCGKEF